MEGEASNVAMLASRLQMIAYLLAEITIREELSDSDLLLGLASLQEISREELRHESSNTGSID
jgi:orotate phosphoribosyltransferase-like protein